MPMYYIVSNNGFLKQYFSDKNLSPKPNDQKPAIFSVSLRSAKSFMSIEEAKIAMVGYAIENCLIIDQNGETQIY